MEFPSLPLRGPQVSSGRRRRRSGLDGFEAIRCARGRSNCPAANEVALRPGSKSALPIAGRALLESAHAPRTRASASTSCHVYSRPASDKNG